ncbi:MAG: hypothetical protein H6937_02420 [Burkholderiales bacterium]|nr:hypothetical protein [Burkholderiales bacterium]
MSMLLRQSTASQEILIGPFLDDTDGKTAETGLTIANTDIKLWKDSTTTESNKNSGGATHIAAGRYYAVLDATDTDTLGKLEVNIHVSGALPVRREFMVLPANVYDSLVSGTDNLEVDTITLTGAAVTTVNSQVDTALVDIHLDHLFATDYDPASKPGTSTALLNELIENDGGVSRYTANALEQAPGGSGGNPQLLQSTTIATLASQVSFTITNGSGDDDAYNNALAIITDQSTSTQKAVACISDYVGSTKTITLLDDPAIFTMAVGDTIDIIVGINQKFPGNFQDLQVSIGTGRVTVGTNQDKTGYEIAGTNTRLDDLNDIAATDIVSNGAITTLSGAVVNVDTVDTCTTNTDMVSSPPTAASIADAVWDEAQSGHTTAGTFGKYLDSEVSTAGGGSLTAADIADAVWDEAITGHLTAGSTGNALNAAGSAGDPWSTPLPGAYGSGTAGKIMGDIITDTNELQTDWTNGGRLDLIIDAVLSSVNTVQTKTDSLTFTDAGKVDATLQAAVDIKAAVANRIADHILRRSSSNALASSDGDTKTLRSLAGAVAKQVNKITISGSTLTVYEADDSTSLGTQTVTTSASADPVTGLDTN